MIDAIAKFYSRVHIPTQRKWRDLCWLWRGCVKVDRAKRATGGNGGGYGKLNVNGKSWQSHRYIYHLLNGDTPPGYVVGHKCDNRACVNPSHLELITPSENLQQAYQRGRRKRKLGQTPPRYDDVFEAGTAALDKLAGTDDETDKVE